MCLDLTTSPQIKRTRNLSFASPIYYFFAPLFKNIRNGHLFFLFLFPLPWEGEGGTATNDAVKNGQNKVRTVSAALPSTRAARFIILQSKEQKKRFSFLMWFGSSFVIFSASRHWPGLLALTFMLTIWQPCLLPPFSLSKTMQGNPSQLGSC